MRPAAYAVGLRAAQGPAGAPQDPAGASQDPAAAAQAPVESAAAPGARLFATHWRDAFGRETAARLRLWPAGDAAPSAEAGRRDRRAALWEGAYRAEASGVTGRLRGVWRPDERMFEGAWRSVGPDGALRRGEARFFFTANYGRFTGWWSLCEADAAEPGGQWRWTGRAAPVDARGAL